MRKPFLTGLPISRGLKPTKVAMAAIVMVIAGRAVTLVLDNSGAETEHDLVVSAYGFRVQARAGETARKSTVFEKPGEYEYSCDLPGHRDAGMKGTLIVRAF